MTLTTIKVESQIRDLLKEQARQHNRTLGEHLEVLLAAEERRARFEALRSAREEHPPDEEYERESREWLSEAWS